ncbi:hypothetical protein B9G53_16690 [Pseudanabaena sp. SR411]|uniref:hypothetical protein n=1 Tax=Pseudanabaena sp. SR411 TaxID=1980935 RepID=UPI000BD3F11D|nr:hypothetical protein [Pseudanabaena sp. SR411]OYQ63488.1 hypothetical protein B9G53_16690 [Pseudanabaena sp. SR411]
MVTRKNTATKDKSRVAARKMNDEIIAIYCPCDDILRAMNHQGAIQQQMSDKEMLPISIRLLLFYLKRKDQKSFPIFP